MGVSPTTLAQTGLYNQIVAVGRRLWGYEDLPLQKVTEGAGVEIPLWMRRTDVLVYRWKESYRRMYKGNGNIYASIHHLFLLVLKALSNRPLTSRPLSHCGLFGGDVLTCPCSPMAVVFTVVLSWKVVFSQLWANPSLRYILLVYCYTGEFP